MIHLTVEESLRAIEDKAALLRYLASGATVNIEPPDHAVLGGIMDVCGEIEQMARAVRGTLSVDALSASIKRIFQT